MNLDLCRHLRWKGRPDDLDGDELALVVIHNHVPYQCLRTCQPWGTDGAPAAPETCDRGRACFTGRTLELSPELSAAFEAGDDGET